MKNPFRRFKHEKTDKVTEAAEAVPVPEIPEQTAEADEITDTAPKEPEDDFTEWMRSLTRGGIERRERNDIFEAYSVFGADSEGRLICRYYHRYPEHEKDFDLSYSRVLSFTEFNRRLLSELDKGDMKLPDYNFCISMAEQLSGDEHSSSVEAYSGFTDNEIAALNIFCEDLDTLKDKSYLSENGVYRCDCESVAGGESLNIRFRKPLTHDAVDEETPGVLKENIGGYDLDDIWIMGVFNRLNERCSSCRLSRLTSEWSINKETVYIIKAEGFDGVEGTLLAAVGEAGNFPRFGFYSLDFSKK